MIFDSGLKDESKIVTYVATDNYNGGVIAARRMGEVLHGQGNVILLRYFPGSESTERREQGFLDTLQKEFPKIVILSSDQYSGTTPEESLTKATQVLNKYKKEVNGLFAVCEPNASGCLEALEQTELDGKVGFIAFDPNPALIRGLAAKKVQGIVLQDPVKMGYEAVMSMHKHLQGEKVPKRIDTGSTVATPENMSEARIQQLLKPQQSRIDGPRMSEPLRLPNPIRFGPTSWLLHLIARLGPLFALMLVIIVFGVARPLEERP